MCQGGTETLHGFSLQKSENQESMCAYFDFSVVIIHQFFTSDKSYKLHIVYSLHNSYDIITKWL